MRQLSRITLVIFLSFLFCISQLYAGQCQATTKKGTQCKRQAAAGSAFCWQHGGSTQTKKVESPVENQVNLQKEEIKKEDSKKQEYISSQCQAITKKGTQCKRRAKAGSNYCWQHGG